MSPSEKEVYYKEYEKAKEEFYRNQDKSMAADEWEYDQDMSFLDYVGPLKIVTADCPHVTGGRGGRGGLRSPHMSFIVCYFPFLTQDILLF